MRVRSSAATQPPSTISTEAATRARKTVRPNASPVRTERAYRKLSVVQLDGTGGRPTAFVRAVATTPVRGTTTARTTKQATAAAAHQSETRLAPVLVAGSVVDVRTTRSRGPSNRSTGATTRTAMSMSSSASMMASTNAAGSLLRARSA